MRVAFDLTFFALSLTLLTSCSSPPKPPTVDESQKRAINSATAVELQACTHELHNTRLLASESSRLAESNAAALSSIAARQNLLASLQRDQERQDRSNTFFTIHFDLGSSRVDIPTEQARRLLDAAKTAPLVMLRGRTDGVADSTVESRVARDRAAAVRDYLVAAGVDPARIRATYQPVGDHVADNAGPSGRALNRRVEVEIYRALPVAMTIDHADR
jgi:outer membrane protein OmpA-like peptidoglycan-associated protein